ncbi:MAG: N-acetylmuramic acid 6-phosphate etherase [Verrucomicrobiota bacterium]|nr:N-acetylmuramic acid 6-phosphate etherase [Verrucomicrobiota bacterium]
MISANKQTTPLFLGIECGGTRSVALLSGRDGTPVAQSESGPANLRLLNDQALLGHFQKISVAQKGPPILSGLAIGMAGARTESDRERIRTVAAKIWPEIPCYATNDLETALSAAQSPNGEMHPRVLILSGTGSCCFGQAPNGKTAKVGGWGHFLGDKGSGYEIGLRALKAVVFYYDRDGSWPLLGQKILRLLQLNEPNDLIGWVQTASKSEIAALAVPVFEAWNNKDKIARDIIASAAASLAQDAVHCARRLVKANTLTQFILAGSILLKQPRFARAVEKKLEQLWKKAIITPLTRDSVWGAVELAKKHFSGNGNQTAQPARLRNKKALRLPVLASHHLSLTEQRNPVSRNLDQLSVSEMIALMVKEDAKIPAAILAESQKIEQAILLISAAFKKGGRLFYVGAGTSGRLGVLDASECPPTFRTPPEMVQGIIAGGQTALWKAVEGAEDDLMAGAEAINYNGITKKDVVVGIAASGRTPFVWGALQESKARQAATILICFDPEIKIFPKDQPKIIIAPNVGPEILTGSTRLKAGTATKLILNMLTTLSMVLMGKVVSNLMVDLNPSNVKLRDRAVRIVREITGADVNEAVATLEDSGWVVKAACEKLSKTHSKKKR